MPAPVLASLGRRIMVCGPSSAGKSTLAMAIGERLGLPVVHLDRLRHLPGTDWVPRPDAEFESLHDAAVAGDAWVMDGNYSRLAPARLARASGIILLGDNRWACLGRYLRRTLVQRHRAGALEGRRDSLKWQMIHWILVASPGNLRRYRATLPATGLPCVEVDGMAALRALYRDWGLSASPARDG